MHVGLIALHAVFRFRAEISVGLAAHEAHDLQRLLHLANFFALRSPNPGGGLRRGHGNGRVRKQGVQGVFVRRAGDFQTVQFLKILQRLLRAGAKDAVGLGGKIVQVNEPLLQIPHGGGLFRIPGTHRHRRGGGGGQRGGVAEEQRKRGLVRLPRGDQAAIFLKGGKGGRGTGAENAVGLAGEEAQLDQPGLDFLRTGGLHAFAQGGPAQNAAEDLRLLVVYHHVAAAGKEHRQRQQQRQKLFLHVGHLVVFCCVYKTQPV